MPLTVRELLTEKSADLKLEILTGNDGLDREITISELNRPGLALGGFLENFRWDRIQVIGRGEHSYLDRVALKQSLDPLKEFFSFKIPCLILTHHLQPRPELTALANQYHVPLVISELPTDTLLSELSTYLEEKIAPTVTLHAVLVDVYGLGLLISGDSGIGKSECALELIKRGHMLVSDDVVQVQHRSGGILVGRPANDLMKHHMEVRGLGIIDVKQLFGMSAILNQSRIELNVHLEMWDHAKEYDRVGLEDHSIEILGVRVPKIIMPVRPGRNLSILVEVSALHQRLKSKGINTAQDIENKLVQILTDQGPSSHSPHDPLGKNPLSPPAPDRSRRVPYRRR